METPYTVPEIARLTGIPETTLYDYVRQFTGIVPEVESSEENGRPKRRYPEQAIAVFQTIRHLKDRGVDLPTIRALLQEDCPPESRADVPIPADTLETPITTALILGEPPGPTITETETEPTSTPEPTTTAATVIDEAATANEESPSVESAAVTETTPETGIGIADEPILRGIIPEYPFFEVPSVEPTSPISVRVEPVTPSEPHGIVETEPIPNTSIPAAPEPIAPAARATTPAPIVDGEIVALEHQLLGGLEESLRGLRVLIDSQNSENQRLTGELKEQRDENERLRATIRYQKDQTRSAERLLAAIKSQCEQGILTIAE
jgi:DNA-binding transcriptional MerR regulator